MTTEPKTDTTLERAKAIVAELKELMKDPFVFRSLGETFFDHSDPENGYESASDVVDAYANGEIVYVQAGIYFAKMPIIWVDEAEDERKLLYGDAAEKAVPV